MKSHSPKFTHYITVLLSLFFFQTTKAIPFRFESLDVSHGLASNSVSALIQDSHGFIWLGTDYGLNRYDGYSFKLFQYLQSEPGTLGCNYVYALYEDRKQQIWVGAEGGVYLFLPDVEEFHFFDVRTSEGNQINGFITAIVEDPQGKIWVSTLDQGVFVYDPNQELLEQYHTNARDQKYILDSNSISSLFVEREGTVWIASRNVQQPLSYYDRDKKQFLAYNPKGDPELLESFSVYAMEEDRNGFLWLGTWTNGLCRLDKRTKELTSFLIPGEKGGVYHIHSLLMYEPGMLLVGSDDGLHYFNTETFEYTQMTYSEFNDKGLSDNFIYPLLKDREGGLWVGTYYGGVNYSSSPRGEIDGYAHSAYRNSVNGNVISCFCEDEKGNIWIGSDDGGLSYLDVQKGEFCNYTSGKVNSSLSYHNVHALLLDNNKLWIGTYSGGLNVLDMETGLFSYYTIETDNERSLDNRSIYAIYKDSEQTIWLGSMSGLMTYDRKRDDFVRMKHTGSTTVDILEDNKGRLWFATGGSGLFCYKMKEKEWIHYMPDEKDKKALPSNLISTLALDENDRLWIGTDRGLCYRDEENDAFVFVPMNVPAPSICDMIIYNEYIWLTTPNGLVRYQPESNMFHLLTQSDGLLNDQFTTQAALLSSSGKLYLGTLRGFNVLDPETILENENIPPVVLTNLQVFNKDEIIHTNGILSKSLNYTSGIELSYKQNVFSIEYAALSYRVPGKNEYRYKLEGFDKSWNDVGNQRKATYTNLPAGRYTFHVVASNNDGIWNDKGTSIRITIHPPFWKTTWAYLFYILLTIAIVSYLIYLSRKRTKRKHEEKIRQLHAEKEKELHDAKIRFFTMIAHEIRTPVSLIIGPLEKIMEKTGLLPSSIQSDLKIIDRNSQRLLSLVNQLLDFRKAEQGVFVIYFSQQNVQELLRNLYVRFKPLVEQKEISFYLNLPEQPVIATVDPEAITKVVSNLLTNALKYAKNEVTLSFTADDEWLNIRVTDDGRGIQPQEMDNIFQPFYQVAQNHVAGTGIGLSLVKLLVDAHHGKVDVDSQPDRLTSFTVRLPIEQKENVVEQRVNPVEMIAEENPLMLDKQDQEEEQQTTMLIVEDNAEMRNFLCENFEWGYSVLLADNGKEGFDQLRKHRVDIIISDVMMPVMDGITFSKKVKENIRYCHIPLILLTAKTDADSKMSGIQSGADAYVEKPFSPQMLRAQVENLLNSRRILRKKFSEMPFVPLDSVALNKADEQFLANMNKIIGDNISNMDFTINQLAEQLYVSRSGLFSKIKNLLGMTPNDLIQLVRLKKAAELLATNEYKINEICYQIGFNNPSYFTKCFQKQFGVLPKDFAGQIRKNDLKEEKDDD